MYASIYPVRQPVAPAFAAAVARLEQALGMPVWLLVQPHGHHRYANLEEPVRAGFYKARHQLRTCRQVALVIDSPGGSARSAYQLATMLRRHCDGFVAVIPRYAKSAATLLTLGAERIYMGLDAELGPLDAQLLDMDREDWSSALDEVQALERLNVAALEQVDQAMMMLVQRTGKKIETLTPQALKFTADMMRPLLERIDTVHYIKQSRVLKVAEDYAMRLLVPKYGQERSREIGTIDGWGIVGRRYAVQRRRWRSWAITRRGRRPRRQRRVLTSTVAIRATPASCSTAPVLRLVRCCCAPPR